MIRKPLRQSVKVQVLVILYISALRRPLVQSKHCWTVYIKLLGKVSFPKFSQFRGETQINLWLTLTQVHLSSPAADSPFLTQGTNLHSTVMETALTLETGVQELKNSRNSQCTLRHQIPHPHGNDRASTCCVTVRCLSCAFL